MAKVKSPYADLMENAGRMVGPGEVIEIPDSDLASYLEVRWEPADKQTKALADKLREPEQQSEES